MRRLFALLLLALSLLPTVAARAAPITIAAAADLREVMPGLVADFARATGLQIVPVYGASGSLVQQMLNGAPHQLLLAADMAYPQALLAAGKGEGPVRAYALGRLALLARADAGVRDLASLKAALAAGRVRHLAIANPATAPYGRLAEAALRQARLASVAGPALVLGENVAQAAQYVASGGAEAGLVSAAQARALAARAGLVAVDLPASVAPPLVQGMVLARGAGPEARAFARWIAGPQGRQRLRAAGFGSP